MKICLLGPTYPFRGGIAHYTTLLYRELKKRHRVRFFGFRRQYPRWLFPGETDRDPSLQPLREDDVEYILDSLNPFTWIKLFLRARKENPELFIFPWWSFFWLLPFWSITFALKRFTPVKILFICHSVVEHEANFFSRLAAKLVLGNGDYFIVQSEEEAQNLRNIFSFARVKICFNPSTYFKSQKITKLEARKRLNIKVSRVILFFGFIRPYKGLRYLIEALPEVLKEMDVLLLIAGEFWDKKEDYERQIARCNLQEKVKIADRYIPDEEVGIYFSAADIVVLPYVSVTGSGIVSLAFEQEKPVVVSDVGALAEIVEDNKTGFLVPPKDSQAIARAIIAFYKEDKDKEFIENVRNKRKEFSWERLVKVIESFKDD